MTWRIAMGTLLLAFSSLRSFVETGSDFFLSGGAAAENRAGATDSVGEESEPPESRLASNETENWTWMDYSQWVHSLHTGWLWVVRTVAWNLLPFNRSGVLGWLVHQLGQAAFGGKWIYVQVALGLATVIFILYIFGSVLGVVAFSLEWAVIRPSIAVWRLTNSL
eukprot:4040120-Amphidinium_carterae.1